MGYLSESGLTTLWAKLKATFATITHSHGDATTSASGMMSSEDKTKLNGIASGAEVNVQADWSVTDTSSDAYIANKPSIPTNYAGSNSAGGPANKLYGIYTANGGQQGPSYFGTNAAGCLMSNASVNGDSHYKNWLYMDNYSGTDVGGTTAFGLDRTEARAFIMQSAAARSSWANTAELHSTATIKCGTSDLTAGSSALTTGHIYFVYE